MSLWMDLHVGKLVIGRLEVIRTTGKTVRTPQPDHVFTYQVFLNGNQVATVDHRYGDGGWALLRAALNKIGDDETPRAGSQ
jgi:hypothetical protein